jgi:uncharacterized Fe-S cluster protein YjdI/CDGSH-type Zn-finger protein
MSGRLHVYEADGITVTFDAKRCIHNGHCVRTLPAVFDTAARPWVQPGKADPTDVLTVVAGCPTGALQATRSDGHTANAAVPAAPVHIQLGRNGPLFVRGSVEITLGDNTALATDARVALCRCGLSARKPFCDNSHRAAGWRDTAPADVPTPAE